MSIYEALKRDHDEVSRLLKAIEETRDGEERLQLFDECKHMLLAHSEAENEVFYDRLKGDEATGEQIRDSIEEHEQIEMLLAKIDDLDPDDREFDQRVRELSEAVQHHVGEEEGALFDRAKEILGDDGDGRIEEKFLDRKQDYLDKEPLEEPA